MKRVLFVDDEAPLLDGLRARLHALRHRWELVFVESGARAITEIEHRSVDVIVTDMRMPGMDGAQLLDFVAQRWPETIRIVLSGYAEDEQTARLLPLAHQYMSKPCESTQLETVVERCLQLHQLLREPRLRKAVGNIRQLPPLPRTYQKVRAVLAHDDPSVVEIASIVGADSAITAKVLQVVNSAFYRRAKCITKIEHAIARLGFAAVGNIVIAAELHAKWPARLPPQFDAQVLQAKAHKVAAAARALIVDRTSADEAMLAGLLHNLGYWVLALQCPDELVRAASLAERERLPMHLAQRQTIGASHAEVGAYLLGLWGLPHGVIEAVAFQHTPRLIKQSKFDLVAAVATAEKLVSSDTAQRSAARHSDETGPDAAYLRELNTPFDWTEAEAIVRRAIGEPQS
jgi:HD-like signal output (HDOD) protein